ncbi:MAG: hypothetical protein J0M10_13695 [Chitinophagales bacterium]|nr:hypothetical protein [Chitinophagales bacterium]
MKKTFLLTPLFHFLITLAVSGQSTVEIEMKDLIVPSSPAFSLLDNNPKTIERPGTIKALALNLVNKAGESGGLPKNLALEFAPFWLFKTPGMNIYKFNGIETDDEGNFKKQHIFSGLRSTSISLGSIFKDSSKTIPVDVNYLAYGIRANLINIRSKKILQEVTKRIVDINTRLSEAITNLNGCTKFTPGTPEYLKCFGESLSKSLKNDSLMKIYRAEYVSLATIRPLFSADLAFASSTAFGNNIYSNHHVYRTGAWLTLALSKPLAKSSDINKQLKSRNYINAYGMLRRMNSNTTKDFSQFTKNRLLDLGGRIEIELDKVSFSVETIRRNDQDNKNLNTGKTVGIIQYRISETLYFLGTFGKDFEKVNNLIALFGINWGFGSNALFQKFR